ncbi:ABC transporter substrate-binding protein [Lacrimispora sphenoides]|uniref:Multiple sugar transport system substrate-binding protein n=1 Tax=Lacrimispora sphenoides JCM 1415 TaxID=1297793 RepID=A0ABY1CC89_9FIRM|nr:extracellular solute-binding protein [Lacrimispora sphenoides]SET91838.1 multiple sugar transport system substrate-binding protein [[Clostridium] sphenoides JCM 1415]SUY52345.1 extracellular solute-binding protein [Lacrimispora sphenoides]
MKLRRLSGILLAGLMAAGTLAGCSGSKTDTTTAAAGGQTAAQTEAEKTQPASGEKTVIKVWSKDRHDATYVQKKVDEYNASNTDNIQVDYQLYTDNYVQAIDMAVQSGELPDILVQQDQMFDKYVNEGQWADFYDYMDSDMKEYFKSVVYPGYNELDGKLYFIPTTGTTCRLFYNKEIFDRVGISEPPKTLEEVVEYAKKINTELSKEGIYGFAENMKSASSGLQRSILVGLDRETGLVRGYDFVKGEYDFSQWADTLKLWKELLSDECAFPGCESLDIDPLRTQFAAGKIGMYMSYSHAEPGVYQNQFPMDSSKWDCVPIPTVGGKATGKQYFTGTGSYVLNAKSPNVDKAFKVYKDIFANEDYLIGYYEGGFGVSILPSVIEKAKPGKDFQDKKWLLISDIDALLPKPPHTAFASGMVVEGEDMFKTCESIYYGDADIDSTLKDLTDRYNKAYQEAVKNGSGHEVKIENYDPMNPTLQ